LENVTPLFNSLLMYDARGSTSQLSFKLIKCLHYKKKYYQLFCSDSASYCLLITTLS
jgi:hypothetical protein